METAEAVRRLAEKIVEEYKAEVDFLCKSFRVTKADIIDAWVMWDTGINEYDNTIYSSVALRIAMHLHNYVHGNWHDKRQQVVLDLLYKTKPSTIAEIGFGTPQRYVTDYVLRNDVHLTLLDFDSEGLFFAESFLNSIQNDWKTKISLRRYDMNSNEDIGEYDCYIFQDSIEHANNPTEYLSKVVDMAPRNSHFILTLPIEVDRSIPEHNIFWKNKAEGLHWLEKAGLTIMETADIEMDKELDLFTKFLHPDFKEVVVLAVKKF